MTCSRPTIFTRDQNRRRAWAAVLAAALCAAPAVPGLEGRGWAQAPAEALALIVKADSDLARSDGIAAEMRLKQALARGATRADVAALMGEALIDQGRLDQAHGWLGAGDFTPATAARGWRALAHLARLKGRLPDAGRALDRAKALTPRDGGLWVEIASLRYAGGEHTAAIEAAELALELSPTDVGALVFKGLLVRDRFGLAAALPWLEAALAQDPDDMQALGEYAATLGDMGRAREMLAVTRRMLALDGRSPRALYLQAVLAARAGNTGLARKLLARAGDGVRNQPAAMLLSGALELEAGNHATAIDVLERLAARQPANARARLLLARAIYLSGDNRQVIARFAEAAMRADAPPYLMILVARAYENLGQRDLAAPLLDRAARDYTRPIAPAFEDSGVGAAIAAGNAASAQAQTGQWAAQAPGNAAYRSLAGDAELALGRPARALDHYREAARVRLPASLLIKMTAALEATGEGGEAARLVEARLAQDPANPAVIRLAAATARAKGDWRRVALLLETLRANGGGRDARLLIDIAHARTQAGDGDAALASAREAWRLQRSSGFVAQVYAAALRAAGQDGPDAAALRAKARAMGADYVGLPTVRYIFGNTG